MPKKPPRNAFYFYMKDIEPELRRQGRVFPNGMADLAAIAGPRWKALPQKERDRYENMAKDFKKRLRGTHGDNYKYDNVGNVIAKRKDPYEELEKRRQQEREEVRSRWPQGQELVNETFYVIHFNTLCMTDDGICLPCEVGLVEYSMQDGIKRFLHRFINPGKIPSGYRFTCNQKSEDTHQIPVTNFELADDNHRGLLIQLENFINQDGEKDHYPPLFCKGKDVEETELSLAFIHGQAQIGRPMRITKVYELEGLIVDIYAHLGRNMSKSMVSDMLSTNAFDYNADVQCEWHAEKDVKYCSLGIARRYTYVMSDNLSDVYGFKLTKNHLPDRSNIIDSISVMYQPKPVDLPTPRPFTASARSASTYVTPRDSPMSYRADSSTSSSPRNSPILGQQFPARDFRYHSQTMSIVDDDTGSHRTGNTFDTHLSAPPSDKSTTESYDHSTVASRQPESISSVGTRMTGLSRGRGNFAPDSTTALWRRGASHGDVHRGVGRGAPIAVDTGSVCYPERPPGAEYRSVFPLPRPEHVPLHQGRGFAPEKALSAFTTDAATVTTDAATVTTDAVTVTTYD